jgi:tRNA(Ile)-lysidine synthase
MPRNKDNVVAEFLSAPSVAALNSRQSIAVALSGGPDSMALLYLLSHHSKIKTIYALTIDHGLRKESAQEAKTVGEWVGDWPKVDHHIIRWTGQKPKAAIMENARAARYKLMHKFCAAHDVKKLFLGHNETDQAETFLFRLAKGSGIDGLGAMCTEQVFENTDLVLLRPLLGVPKTELQAFCTMHKIPHVQDPTNQNMDYARARLRHALPVLEEEGLSVKRLARTAKRLASARDALDHYTDRLLRSAMVMEKEKIVFKLSALRRAPVEIRIRAIRRSLSLLETDGYGPRLERLEDLLEHVFADLPDAKRFTLGGFIFTPDLKRERFTIIRE